MPDNYWLKFEVVWFSSDSLIFAIISVCCFGTYTVLFAHGKCALQWEPQNHKLYNFKTQFNQLSFLFECDALSHIIQIWFIIFLCVVWKHFTRFDNHFFIKHVEWFCQNHFFGFRLSNVYGRMLNVLLDALCSKISQQEKQSLLKYRS